MVRRYYLSMLSLALVVLCLGFVSMWLAGRLGHLSSMAINAAVVLVGVNLIGARVLLGPVCVFLDVGGSARHASARIRMLPFLSAGWALVLIMAFMYAQHYFHYMPTSFSAAGMPYFTVVPIVLIAIFAVLMALYVYFLVGDYTAWLRERLFLERGLIVDPGSGRLLHRLIVTFVAVSLVPLALFFAKEYLMDAPRQVFAGLGPGQITQIDAMASALLMTVAIVSASRVLTRPVRTLLSAMQRVGHGDLSARAPAVSDDELGRLSVGFNAMAERLHEQAFIRETFGKFVPPSIVSSVLRDRGLVRPQLREATILFTDVERFTAIAEMLSPEQVISMLNDYFTVVAEPIHAHGGIITQFQGDAILASFNLPLDDPEHAANALRAARDVQRALTGRRFGDGVALHTRVGINSGSVVGGTVGDGDRLGYTVHGDAVNLAARLEQLNKQYGSRVLASERTVELAGAGFDLSEIGEVVVRGRAAPVRIYELRA